jgi:mRNA-degrading endonuclease RelE of RelBE toxin-antitoxin system/DNA-binding XRE family transcriptional regulator
MRVAITDEAQRDIDELPVQIRDRVRAITIRLSAWPNVSGAKHLTREWAGFARVRTGSYRVIFRAVGDVVFVVKVDDRKDVYGRSPTMPISRRVMTPMPRRVRTKGAVDAALFITRSIARDLKQARLDAGLTQMEVAAKLRVSQSMVNGVEHGRIRVGQKYIHALLKVCGQPADYPKHRRVLRLKLVKTARRAASPKKR